MADIINNNPWKGLNYYVEGEVLYGRDYEIESLSQYILNNTQTVLYGKSGIGKSSILNAGIFPIARKNGLIPISIRLDHNSSSSYISQICNAIINSGVVIDEMIPVVNKERESLWEFFHRNRFCDKEGNQKQLLLIFDQFEEIFTLQSDHQKILTFFDDLAGLLNDVTPLYIVNANKKEKNSLHNDVIEISDDLKNFDISIDVEDTISDKSSHYLQKIDYHIVFTLREDFLSYLERYTKYIPTMRSNRYALLPINVVQAKDIILKPVEGLVDVDVADLIIQKVTGKNEIKQEDEKNIDVDSAMLSLYLSRLYIKKGTDKKITSELVNEFSEVIIKDFYEEAIENLPSKEIETIEDQLLTYDGRRNNVSYNDLLREGVSKDVITILTEDRKILRMFSYQGDIRVEFIHDKLCSIVNDRIEKREEIIKREEEKRAQQYLLEQERQKTEKYRKKMKRNRWLFIIASLLLFLILLPFLFSSTKTQKECQLLLVEDETVGIDNYWKAEVTILGRKSDTLFPSRLLDKTNSNTIYTTKDIDNVRIIVRFLAGNFSTIDTTTNISSLSSITIPISRAHGRKKYEGKIISSVGSRQPLNDAVVIIGGQITKTNYKGSFVAFVDNSDISNDGYIRVYKNGYKLLSTKLENEYHLYMLQPEDAKLFNEKLKYIQGKIIPKGFDMEGVIGEKYSSHLTACIENDSIFGLFYYDKSVQKVTKKEEAYILFTGKLNNDGSFHLDCCDDAYNLQELNGVIDKNGIWEGYWHSYSKKLEKFRFVKIKDNDEK